MRSWRGGLPGPQPATAAWRAESFEAGWPLKRPSVTIFAGVPQTPFAVSSVKPHFLLGRTVLHFPLQVMAVVDSTRVLHV
jgi:hypothetical protein